MKDDKRIEDARRELRRILRDEATHDALAPHFDPFRTEDLLPEPMVRLRKSLRRVLDTLDRRVK